MALGNFRWSCREFSPWFTQAQIPWSAIYLVEVARRAFTLFKGNIHIYASKSISVPSCSNLDPRRLADWACTNQSFGCAYWRSAPPITSLLFAPVVRDAVYWLVIFRKIRVRASVLCTHIARFCCTRAAIVCYRTTHEPFFTAALYIYSFAINI